MNRANRRVHSVLLMLGLLPLAACADESADTASEVSSSSDEIDDEAPPDVTQAAPPPGALTLRLADEPVDGAERPGNVDKGASCGGFEPCGIVYNRSRQTLQLARDSKSHFYCKSPRHFRDLPPGGNSNRTGPSHWPDVDCVRSNHGWMFTNGRWYPPREWVRIWSSKWVY